MFITGAAILFVSFEKCVSQIRPEVMWENLRPTYPNFYEVEPIILNSGQKAIYFESYFSPYVRFERYNSELHLWEASDVWHCGTGARLQPTKINPNDRLPIRIDRLEWYEITDKDSIGVAKFRQRPGYDGTGRYRFKFNFGIKKAATNAFTSYSPEFAVAETAVSAK